MILVMDAIQVKVSVPNGLESGSKSLRPEEPEKRTSGIHGQYGMRDGVVLVMTFCVDDDKSSSEEFVGGVLPLSNVLS